MVVISILYKHATGAVSSKMERDVSTGARDKCGKSDVGGLGEGNSVPDASYGKGIEQIQYMKLIALSNTVHLPINYHL